VLPEDRLPSAFASFASALLPVALLALTTLLPMIRPVPASLSGAFRLFSDPSVVMLLSLAFATFALGIRNGMGMRQVMSKYEDAVRDVSVILLVVAGAGALKQVFIEGGVGQQLASTMKGWSMHPLVLGWAVAAAIRVAMGSATVAGLTTAGIVAPVVSDTQTDPNLMVLAVGAGSLMFSHVNDSGFWMYKEYFNLGIRDTLLSWSLMETVVSIGGLLCVLLLNAFL
jgi:Gnt-I system high-affinity gluconate transporter